MYAEGMWGSGGGAGISVWQRIGTDISPLNPGDNLDMGTGFVKADSIKINDTDDSNTIELIWNEDDSSDRKLNYAVGGGDRTLTMNENLTIGDGTNVSITAEDNDSAVVLDNANLEVENVNATQRNMKLVHGTDADATLTLEGTSSVINQDVSSDGSPTFTQVSIATNTTISESSGDTLTENTSATNDVIEKLGDDAGATAKKIVDSNDVVLQQVDSDGTNTLGVTTVDSVLEGKTGAGVSEFKFNSSGDSYVNGGSLGVGTKTPNTKLDVQGGQTVKVTTVNAATYDLLITDYILNVTYTVTGAVTSLTIPTAQTVSGRVIIVKDAGGNATTNSITIDTEGSEKIDGVNTLVISSNYDAVMLYSDGSDWFIF